MFPTAHYPISANRFVPFSDYVDIVGYDFTGATLSMQVRDSANGGIVRATVTPTIGVTTDEGVPTTRVSFSITETVMEAMPLDPLDPSRDVALYYDCHLTPDGGTKFVPFGGPFIVEAGVTQ